MRYSINFKHKMKSLEQLLKNTKPNKAIRLYLEGFNNTVLGHLKSKNILNPYSGSNLPVHDIDFSESIDFTEVLGYEEVQSQKFLSQKEFYETVKEGDEIRLTLENDETLLGYLWAKDRKSAEALGIFNGKEKVLDRNADFFISSSNPRAEADFAPQTQYIGIRKDNFACIKIKKYEIIKKAKYN